MHQDLEDLPRVSLLEDEEGAVHLRNLSAHRAGSEASRYKPSKI